MAKSKFSIEEAFNELDQIIAQMESPDLGLADSMSLYKKGVKLLDKCGQTLNQTAKEIEILQEGSNAGNKQGDAFGKDQAD